MATVAVTFERKGEERERDKGERWGCTRTPKQLQRDQHHSAVLFVVWSAGVSPSV
jgi:hypothetical protein